MSVEEDAFKLRKVISRQMIGGVPTLVKTLVLDEDFDAFLAGTERQGHEIVQVLVLRWTPLEVTPEAVAWMKGLT